MSEPQPVHRIEAGQEYVSVQPTYFFDGPGALLHTRIRVVEEPVELGCKPTVATLNHDGRELRRRPIDPRQLHDNPQRVTGYRLVRSVDGAAADGAQQ